MVEITPQKQKISLPVWRWPLWVASVLAFLCVAAFLALTVYLHTIQNSIAAVNDRIKVSAAKINAGDETTVANLSDSLAVFSGLVANHTYFSGMLGEIGALTYQKVVFDKFDADRTTSVIKLSGVAQNYTALAKQIVALRENQYFQNVEVKGISFGTGGLEFEISALVDSKFFNLK